MLYLYIVRHGQTEWNAEGRIQGRLDSQLTEKGKEYAKLLGEKLQDVPFIQIISSPSLRTMATAEIIKGDREISIIKDKNIMEMDLGTWQGSTIEEIKSQFPEEYDCYRNRPDVYQNKDAESFMDIKKRAENFLEEFKKSPQNGNLLVVTHGLFIKSLFTIFKGIELKDIWTEPTVEGTSLTIVKLDEGHAEIMIEGDMSHLTGKGAALR